MSRRTIFDVNTRHFPEREFKDSRMHVCMRRHDFWETWI